jgi:hypothetical protein
VDDPWLQVAPRTCSRPDFQALRDHFLIAREPPLAEFVQEPLHAVSRRNRCRTTAVFEVNKEIPDESDLQQSMDRSSRLRS